MKRFLLGFPFLGIVAMALGADGAKPVKPARNPGGSGFSLLPKTLQKNPQVDCNILTELTAAGRTLRPPTPQTPVYYFLQPGYYQNLGEPSPASAKPPPVSVLQQLMKNSLATAGYFEATPPQHQPTLVVVFNYGDHTASKAEAETNDENIAAQAAYEDALRERAELIAALEASNRNGISDENREKIPPPPDPPSVVGGGQPTAEDLLPFVIDDPRKQRQLLDRAAMVGGAAFAGELAKVLQEEFRIRQTGNANSRSASRMAAETERQKIVNAASGFKDDLQTTRSPAFDPVVAGPFYRFYHRDEKTGYLVNEAFGSCYFVVASAFDGAALANGEKRLLWRTKMTVNSSGVTLGDVLPALLNSAAPYFGRETGGTVVVSQRVLRNAVVDVGAAAPAETRAEIPSSVSPASVSGGDRKK